MPQPPAFRNPAARLLAEFADAVASEEGWQGWLDRHPDVGVPLDPEPEQ